MSVISDWSVQVAAALTELSADKGIRVEPQAVASERPARKELGDLAFPMFSFAKSFKTSPAAIALQVRDWLQAHTSGARVEAVGSYVNLFLSPADFSADLLHRVLSEGAAYGSSDRLAGKKIMIEFSCPNTNKPLHLGHLRNDALGESVSRLLKAAGAAVEKVNLINNRGIHICKSMLAYQKFGNGTTPQSEGIKGDRFVGNYYVRFDQWSKSDPEAQPQAAELLRLWEQGDIPTHRLWQQMNEWTLSGINETYRKTGISFDRVYFESETYQSGKEEVQKGLKSGVFYRDDEGTVWIDLAPIGLDQKVLQRKDGTSVYITQDIGTAIARHHDFPFDSLIYVVASEQQYHFKVLFYVLKQLGYDWADQLVHLSYGMVNLPEGKMKSREGTVVDADDLFEELSRLAAEEIHAKGRDAEVGDVRATSEAVALGALNYYLLATTPSKDMIFNPKETISFQGNTGPYTQYMGARICSLIRKYETMQADLNGAAFDGSLLTETDERSLLMMMLDFPSVVQHAAEQKNPSLVIAFLYELCKTFSHYYHDHSVLSNPNPALTVTRMTLCRGVLQLIQNCFALTGIPFLEKM